MGLEKTSSVSSAYLLMKRRVAKEKQLVRRVRKIEEVLTKSKQRTDPFWLLALFDDQPNPRSQQKRKSKDLTVCPLFKISLVSKDSLSSTIPTDHAIKHSLTERAVCDPLLRLVSSKLF